MKNFGTCYACSHESVVQVTYNYTGKIATENRCDACYISLQKDDTKQITNERWKNKTAELKTRKKMTSDTSASNESSTDTGAKIYQTWQKIVR